MDIDELLTEIADYRCKMNRLSKGKSSDDPDVIKSSKELDTLISKYLEARRQQNAVIQLPGKDCKRAKAV